MKKNWLSEWVRPTSGNSTHLAYSLAALALFFFFALYFIRERWFYTDSAYTFFRVLNLEDLFYDRYSNALQTWPAQFAAEKNAGPGLVLYLLNFVPFLIAIILYFIAGKWSSSGSWMVPAVFICQGNEAFFLGYNELLFSMLFFALLVSDYSKAGKAYWLIPLLAGPVMLLAHPAAVIAIPFLCLLNLHRGDKISVWILGIAALLYLAKPLFMEANTYDSHMLHRLENLNNWTRFTDHYSFKYFTGSLNGWLMIPMLSAMVSMIALLIQKQFRSFFYILFSLFLVAFISVIAYSEGDATAVMEKYFQPFALICIATLLFIKPGVWLQRSIAFLLVALAFRFAWKTIGISDYYSGNLAMVRSCEAYYHKRGAEKVLVSLDSIQKKTEYSVWALPYETMLISAMENRQVSVNVKPVETEYFRDTENFFPDSTYGTAPFLPPLSVHKLNKTYFRLHEGKYLTDKGIYPWLEP